MSDYDSNIIKPVEGMQNITGMAPARRREQRRRRQQLQDENENQDEQQLDESAEERILTNLQETQPENNSSGNGIDYHA